MAFGSIENDVAEKFAEKFGFGETSKIDALLTGFREKMGGIQLSGHIPDGTNVSYLSGGAGMMPSNPLPSF